MAKDEKAVAVVETFDPTAMMEMTPDELRTSKIGGKRSNYNALSDEDLAILHKKILVNKKIIEATETGKIKTAKFHVIDDNPKVQTLTNEFSIGQNLTFTKDGEQVTVPIERFVEGGSQTYLTYKNESGTEVKFKLTNISAKTSKGNKSLLQF